MPVEFQIIQETPHYVVVEKPAGMLSHPSKPEHILTLWDHLKRALAADLRPGAGAKQISLINRLDRETSGLLLVALTPAAARAFGLAMQNRLIAKEYLALVHGWPVEDSWSVEAPLDAQRRHGEYLVQLRQIVHPAGYPALTEFTVRERLTRVDGGQYALIQARPYTGRTHQIRVHLAHSGHPILGDKLYGPGPEPERAYLEFIQTGWTPALASRLHLRYHALHSAGLSWADIPLHDPEEPDEMALRAGITPAPVEMLKAARFISEVPAEWVESLRR